MKNNNQLVVRKITSRTLRSDKQRNFFVVAAIILTAFMISSVLSIGLSYYETINMHEKRLQGSVSHMAFNSPTQEQYSKLYSLDYVKTVGLGALIAQTDDVPGLENLDIAYVDKSQWQEMFCPTFTNIVGTYPERENEIMLSRHILSAMGISDPKIGMEIPVSYVITGTDETDKAELKTKIFELSCIYTEYSHIRQNGFVAMFTSPDFALSSEKLLRDNMTVNIVFKDANHVSENIERLKQDLAFPETQKYVQSPAFDDNYGDIATYSGWIAIIVFMMFTGYLLIYNVMYISVSKDIRFFGMLKILGTTPKQLRRIILGQVLRLCLIALPVGCGLSTLISLLIVPALISNSSGFDTGAVVSFSPVIYIGAMAFTVLTALIGAATPAKKAANISPVEAVKFEAGIYNKSGVHSPANGNPYKMALRNIFRDRKRAVVVMLSLFLSITIFTSIITIIASMDIDKFVDSQYDFDFSFSSNNFETFSLNEDFVNEVKQMAGVKETAATTVDFVELSYSEQFEKYVEWNRQKYGVAVESIVKNDTFTRANAITGIDQLTLSEINEKLPVPIDAEAFERGEIILINVSSADLIDCFTDVTELDVKFESTGESLRLPVDDVIFFYRRGTFGSIVTFSDMEILVSNRFLRQHSPEPRTLYLDMNAESGADEQIYNTLDELVNPAEVLMDSRIAGRKSMQDAKTIMFVLGGGVSAILALIGIFNFINVMSVGVMSRKREFAIFESVGMSKSQLRSMLRNEGIGYAVITILCDATLGNVIVYGLFCLFKSVADYAVFVYPIFPIVIVCAAILLICLVTPELVYRGVSKMTLVERLREME